MQHESGMARIDPKNDELGLMENIFRGVRSIGSSEKESSEPAADRESAPRPTPAPGGVPEPVGTSAVKPASTDVTPLHSGSTIATHRQESQS
jgi:hypothetical protein